MISLLAFLIITTCVSCGGSSTNEDKTETKTETKTGAKTSNPNIKTTKTPAKLTPDMYDKIELGMTYEQVRGIIGQDPNKVEEMDDPSRPGGKGLNCTWTGPAEDSQYPTPPEITITVDGDEVYGKQSSSL